jgi:hypothetical protein
MICLILGYDNDASVEETISGFVFKITKLTKFKFAKKIYDIIHEQLEHIEEWKKIKYRSSLVYLLIYQ